MNTVKDIKILFEDAWVLVCVKPAGMPAQGDGASTMDMVSYLKNYLAKKGTKGEPYIGLVHRLDRPVGGVMVFAKTQEAAAALSLQIQKHQMEKWYLAVLTGTLKGKEGTLKDYLMKDGKTNLSTVVSKDTKGAKAATLTYKVLKTKFEEGQQYTLAEIHLETGRHHQIRVQMANAKAGLYGDTKYNPLFMNQSGWVDLGLYAYHLSFTHPKTRKKLSFEDKNCPAIKSQFPIL